MRLQQQLLESWRHPNYLTFILWPLSLLYRGVFRLRTLFYALGVMQSYRAPIPVIIVGNITVGGTGKTPLLIALVERVRELGYTPGVISRGYGGDSSTYPLLVNADTDPAMCGDEPALIVKNTGVPMVVGADRKADIQLLIRHFDLDCIISDDGLQHLALQRDMEICIVDKTGKETNYYRLPAGPYRESIERLSSVDLIVEHISASDQGQQTAANRSTMALQAGQPTSLIGLEMQLNFDPSRGIHAVAGIGKPQRFFDTCRSLGWQIEAHALPDHHHFIASELDYAGDKPVLMTEKDAVKYQKFASQRHWYLPVNAKLSTSFTLKFEQLLKRCIRAKQE